MGIEEMSSESDPLVHFMVSRIMRKILTKANLEETPQKFGTETVDHLKELKFVQEIVRRARENLFSMGKDIPPFLEILAYFQLRAAVLQFPDSSEQTEIYFHTMLDLCVDHLAQENCPSQETIKLQVIAQGAMFSELKLLEEEKETRKSHLDAILKEIIITRVQDVTKTYQTVHALYSKFLQYVVDCSADLGSLNADSVAGIAAAFESIFPESMCVLWMDLPDTEKLQQVSEMSDVVTGIRVYNKCMARGGESFKLPYENYKSEAKELGEKVMNCLQKLNEQSQRCAEAVNLYIHSLGIHHVLILRLRDELAYYLQAFTLVEGFQCFLYESFETVTEHHDKCYDHVKLLTEIIGSRSCIPNEMVYPEFKEIGFSVRSIKDELKILQAHARAFLPLLTLSFGPSFECTPTSMANLCSSTGSAKLNVIVMYTTFLQPEVYTVEWHENDIILRDEEPESGAKLTIVKGDELETILQNGANIQFSGYCPVSIAKNRGLLLHGDPDVGLVQIEEKLYTFSDEEALIQSVTQKSVIIQSHVIIIPHLRETFVKSPTLHLEALENVIRKLPQLVHILGLQKTPPYCCLNISEFIDILSKPLACEFSTQTCSVEPQRLTHDSSVFRLARKQSAATQTDSSYYRRSSQTQVWNSKQIGTQTGIHRGTNPVNRTNVNDILRTSVRRKFPFRDNCKKQCRQQCQAEISEADNALESNDGASSSSSSTASSSYVFQESNGRLQINQREGRVGTYTREGNISLASFGLKVKKDKQGKKIDITKSLSKMLPYIVAVTAVAALIHPPTFAWVSKDYYAPALGGIMLSIGVQLSFSDFALIAKRPLPLLLGYMMQYIVKPILGYMVVRIFRVPSSFAAGLILTACVAGAQLSSYAAYLSEGDIALSITLTSISTITSVAVTPFLTQLLIGSVVPVDVIAMATSILQVVFVPVIMGLTLNTYAKDLVDKIRPVMPLFAMLCTSLCIGSPLALNQAEILSGEGLWLILPVLVFHAAAFASGYWIARLPFCRQEMKTAKTLSLCMGMQSSTLAMLLATKFLGGSHAVPPACSVVVMAVMGLSIASFWGSCSEKERKILFASSSTAAACA